jgi:Uma2 family endonuclease
MVLAEIVEQTKTLITARELLQLSAGDKKYELVKGELIELTPPGGAHGSIAAKISWLLLNFIRSHNLGKVMVESGFQLASNPDTVRGPDISFLAAAKVPAEGIPAGYLSGAPDLAVEIVSPGDTAAEIQAKVQDYLVHGSQAVWVVYPQQRVVVVHHPDGLGRTLQEVDTLSGETVVPGFSCQVSDIFA